MVVIPLVFVSVMVAMVAMCPCADFTKYDILVDSIFGFGGKGIARPPYKTLLDVMAKSQVPIVSVDVPSGWDVSTGSTNLCLTPELKARIVLIT